MTRHTLRGLLVLLVLAATVLLVLWLDARHRSVPDVNRQVTLEAYDPVVADSDTVTAGEASRLDTKGNSVGKGKVRRKNKRVAHPDKHHEALPRE